MWFKKLFMPWSFNTLIFLGALNFNYQDRTKVPSMTIQCAKIICYGLSRRARPSYPNKVEVVRQNKSTWIPYVRREKIICSPF